MRTLRIFLFLSMTPLLGYGQQIVGARSLGMGSTIVAIPESRFAVLGNPAMMSSEQRSVSFYGVRYWGFAELTDMAASVTYPTRFGTVGGGVHQFGDLFSRTHMRIGYKRQIRGFHFGVAASYTNIAIGNGYGSDGAVGLDLGVGAELLPDLWLGARATNINQPTLGEEQEELDRDLAVGISYHIANRAFITSELVKDVRFPVAYRGGIEVEIYQGLKGRAGVTTEPTTFSGGFGYEADRWGINIAVQNHQVLGLSPGLDFMIIW